MSRFWWIIAILGKYNVNEQYMVRGKFDGRRGPRKIVTAPRRAARIERQHRRSPDVRSPELGLGISPPQSNLSRGAQGPKALQTTYMFQRHDDRSDRLRPRGAQLRNLLSRTIRPSGISTAAYSGRLVPTQALCACALNAAPPPTTTLSTFADYKPTRRSCGCQMEQSRCASRPVQTQSRLR